MKSLLKTLSKGALALSVLALAACGGKQASEEPKPMPTPAPAPAPAPAPKMDEGPAKVVLEFYNGHLHAHRVVHFVPSGGKFTYKDYFNSQKFTFVRQGDKWVLDPKSDKDFIGYQTVLFGSDEVSSKPNYGLFVHIYDAAGKELNNDYNSDAKRAQHQMLFYPSDVKGWEGEQVKLDPKDPQDFLKYVYCDTKMWDKASSDKGNGFIDPKDPVGFKGYFQFQKSCEFVLNLDLWMNAAGKMTADKGVSFWENEAIKNKGQRLIHLQLPIKIVGDINFQEEVLGAVDEDFDKRAEATQDEAAKSKLKKEPIKLESLDAEFQTVAKRLIKALGAKDWESVCKDMIEYYTTQGDEKSSAGFQF